MSGGGGILENRIIFGREKRRGMGIENEGNVCARIYPLAFNLSAPKSNLTKDTQFQNLEFLSIYFFGCRSEYLLTSPYLVVNLKSYYIMK